MRSCKTYRHLSCRRPPRRSLGEARRHSPRGHRQQLCRVGSFMTQALAQDIEPQVAGSAQRFLGCDVLLEIHSAAFARSLFVCIAEGHAFLLHELVRHIRREYVVAYLVFDVLRFWQEATENYRSEEHTSELQSQFH